MTRILLEDAHAQAGSGAPGERAWSRELNNKIIPLLAARGIETVRVPGTTADLAIYHEDFLCFITNHYDADIYNHIGGAFWDRAAASITAAKDDMLGALIWGKFREIVDAPVPHFERRNANTRDYYAFRYTSNNTPGIIMEWGVGATTCNGHNFPTAPDHDFLRTNIDAIALCVAEGVLAYHMAQGGSVVMPQSPVRAGQSQDLQLAKGQVGAIGGIWRYANGLRTIHSKVYALTPGRRIYTMYPPVDPDADQTEDVSAEPCIFVIDTTP